MRLAVAPKKRAQHVGEDITDAGLVPDIKLHELIAGREDRVNNNINVNRRPRGMRSQWQVRSRNRLSTERWKIGLLGAQW
jgi:hypothetical protein